MNVCVCLWNKQRNSMTIRGYKIGPKMKNFKKVNKYKHLLCPQISQITSHLLNLLIFGNCVQISTNLTNLASLGFAKCAKFILPLYRIAQKHYYCTIPIFQYLNSAKITP